MAEPLTEQELARMESHPNLDDRSRLIAEVRRANAEIAAWEAIFDELPPGACEIAAVVKYVADLRHDNERLREDLTATAHALDSAAGDRLNLRRVAEELAEALKTYSLWRSTVPAVLGGLHYKELVAEREALRQKLDQEVDAALASAAQVGVKT